MLAQRLGVDVRTAQRQAVRLSLNPTRAGTRQKANSFSRGRIQTSTDPVNLPEYQSQWLQLQRDRPTYGRLALREAAPALHAFLYRHARNWLEQHSPVPRQPKVACTHANWNDRDIAISSGVAEAAKRLLTRRPLIRLTRTALLREAGSIWAVAKLPLLPLTKLALERLEEDRAQFAVRRIEAVSSAESGDGSILPKWRLIRCAGLRPELLALNPVRTAIRRALRAHGEWNS
jgi:hypothetical protein